MDHDEPGRRSGRPRPGPVPGDQRGRPGPRQQPPRGSARRAGAPRKLASGRGAARPPRQAQRPPLQAQRPPAPAEPIDVQANEPPVPPRPRALKATKGPHAPKSAKGPKSPKAPKNPKAPKAAKRQGRGGRPGHDPRWFFFAAGALGLVVVLAAVAMVVIGGRDDAPTRSPVAPRVGPVAASGPAPASYSSSPSADAYSGIAQRSADAAPLTAAELFPSSASTITLSSAKAKLTLKGKRLDTDCAAAIWGRSVAAALGEGGCTQAARTLHADTKKGYALAVTVFNLASADHADRIVEQLGNVRGGGFVRPLNAAAPLDKFGQGFGMARGLAMGHYVVVSWAQHLDGSGDEQDEDLLSLLIEGGKAPAVLGRAAKAS
ncbi:hypothetical protein [Actinomadura rudentiformis]|uniref:Uncharacterized protein n=1 Tax=Actinomadura rudentiformis TaxID=359158 RepID=A0A6H9YN38_9ACTN|nr:hypothetical protein [Actinomadura rudentiformis]KAB2342737.1 hypothetical protein F8566_37550 [Actinomadura rudentiformis]